MADPNGNRSASAREARAQAWSRLRSAAVMLLLAAGVAPAAAAPIPRFDHVVVMVMENHSYAEIIGNDADAPWINALASRGALFTQSYAVEHPSEPNYLDLFSGSNQGVTDDSCPHTFSTASLGGELLAAGATFVGYSEDLPEAGSTVCTSGLYARKHSPWVDFDDVPNTNNQPFSAFPSAFAQLPTVSFVIPNLCNDMHNGSGCPVTPSIASGDTWLQANLDAYAQWAPAHDSLLILTFDEDDHSQSNRIVTIFAGARVIPGTYNQTIDHFTVLGTLEAMYGVAATGSAARRTPIADVWDSTIFVDGFEQPATAAP